MSKKNLSVVAILLALFLIVSCRESELITDEYRNDLSLKSELKQKEIYRSLDADSKLKLWKNKFEQIKRQDVSSRQRELIDSISEELSKIEEENFDGQKLFEYAIKMAQITPEDEFIRMFSRFEDYKRNNSSYEEFAVKVKEKSYKSYIEVDLINYLSKIKEGKVRVGFNEGSNVSISDRIIPICNCRWTCLFYGVTNNKCRPSNRGCGFLLIQDCGGYIG